MKLIRSHGFTLIELVVVIMVLAIVSISVVSFVRFGADIYQDGAGRARQIAESRFLIERMTRELREAVPNSVRVLNNKCIEFMPIISSSSYVDAPVAPEGVSDSITIVAEPGVDLSSSSLQLLIYPSNPADVYGLSSDKRADINSISSVTNNKRVVTLDSNVLFAQDSPTQRYFIVHEPVSYCQGGGNKIYRAQGYNISQVQPNLPTGGVLMAQFQSNQHPFSYQGQTLIRNALVQLNFEFSYNDETLKLYNEVHIANVP